MIITTEYVHLPAADSPMRIYVAAPKREGAYPGILCYSDIFQLTPSTLRVCARLAGHGFVVAAPEIYHRLEPAGTALPFDDAGRDQGLDDAARTSAAEFDADARVVLDYLAGHPRVGQGKLGVAGFCIGGHLAFRAAMQADVRATVCFYATGLHDGKLGRDEDAGSLERAGEITGELLMIFGSLDPHVPEPGRQKIDEALQRAGTNYSIRLYPAEHAFMRDEGPRYDSYATDLAFGDMIATFQQAFGQM